MTQPITARHDLTIWRNDDYYEYPIRVVGLDLTGIALVMEIRLGGDVTGAPLISLPGIVPGVGGAVNESRGVQFRGVSVVDGVETSELRVRIDRGELQGLPYSGERGDAAEFEYALVIGGRTRMTGRVILPAHTYRSDAAPANRPASYGTSYARQAGYPDAGATLTIALDGGATVQVDGADLVSASILRAESARDIAVTAADNTVAALDSLGQDAFNYVGRPGDAVLVTGTPKGVGSVFWHDAVDVAGDLASVDVFDRAAGVVNVAVYRGPLNALARVALGSFATTGTRTSRRIALAAPLSVRAGDILAIQPADGALTVAELQSGDVGYTYSSPFLPENVSLGAPTTNGQVQVRFVITYREQIVTADNFLALSEIRVIGARARALSSAANPAGYVAWTTTGAPTGHTVTWGSYTAKLGPLADRMEFPQWSVSKPLFVVGNSLSDSTEVLNRWSQVLAARYGQHLVSVARYSSDQRMVYRTGAAPINLTLAGALPVNGSVAVTQINGAPIDGNNPAAFLTTGDPAVVTGMSMTGYASRNGVERKVTVSAPNGASFAYSVTQAPGQTAIEFDGPVLFTPEASLSIRGSTCIVWPGNNYFYSQVPNQYGDYTNPQMWVDLKLIVSLLQSQGCQVLLLPVIPASLPEWVEGVGTPLTASRAANARTAMIFPGLMARHADGRDLIEFLQDRKDGSADAQADVNKGWIPRNLHRAGDPLHLNADGDIAVADFVDSALRSQVGPPAITQATAFTITAEGPQAGTDATSSVRVERDQLASLADAVDGVVQDAVYRPTIAAAIADFEVGTFFVSRDLDGLTAHTGVKWQYKVTAAAPHFSDEGPWSDTNAAALGLDAYVGTTPGRLPVSAEQASADQAVKVAALAATSDLGLMTGYALDRRVRTDVAQPLSDAERSTALTNIGAVGSGLFNIRVPIVAIEELGGKGDFDPVTMTGTDNSPAFAKARRLGLGVLLGTAARYGITDEILTYTNMVIVGDSACSPEIWPMFAMSGKKMIHSDLSSPTMVRNVALGGFKLMRFGAHAEHGALIDNVDGLYVRIMVLSDGKAPGGAFGVSAFQPECRPSKNCDVELVLVTGGNNFALQFGNVDGGRMRIAGKDCARESLGLEPYVLGKYRFSADKIVGDTFVWPNHGLTNAYPLIYSREAGVTVPGLAARANGWFAIVVDANTIKIAASKEDAIAGIAIALGGAPAGFHALYKCGILRNIIVEASYIDTDDVPLNGTTTGVVVATATSGGYIEGTKMMPWTSIEHNPTSGSQALTVLGVRGFDFGNLTAIGHKNAAVVVSNGTLNGLRDANGASIDPMNQDESALFGLQLFSEGTIENVTARGFLKDGIAITGDIVVKDCDLRSSVATGRAVKLLQDSEVNLLPMIENVTVKVPAAVPIATVASNGALLGPILRQRGCRNLNDETSAIDYIATRFVEQKITKVVTNVAPANTADASKTTLVAVRSANVSRSSGVFSGRVRVVARTNATTSANIAVYDLAITKAAPGSGTGQVPTVVVISSQGLTAGSSANWPSFAFGFNSLAELAIAVVGSTATAGPYVFEIESRGDLLIA